MKTLTVTVFMLLLGVPLDVAHAQFDTDHNHLECYSIKPAQRFTPISVTVQTQFGTHIGVLAKKPIRLCLPAKKTGGGVDPLPPTAVPHFLCYKVKFRFRANQDVRLTDQFGTIRERVFRPQLLCNPVEKTVLP